jgi:hydrogenase large subunit
MATITIDPVNRIEGHMKAVVGVDPVGNVTSAALTGNLFRGFELIMNKRDPRDAPQITQRICGVCPTPHGLASVKCLDTALGITNDDGKSKPAGATAGNINTYSTSIPDNGRVIRNIIHGIDIVGDHITHLYHLSALDFINTSSFPGMAPWMPSYTASDMLDGSTGTGQALVLAYVTALSIRRKAHTAQALFAGRMPIQNALVPGGVTTLLSSTYPRSPQSGTDYDMYGPYNVSDTKARFTGLLNQVRAFIDGSYINNVLAVASTFSAYWTLGAGCGNLLSYGDYPLDSSGTLATKRGWTDTTLAYNTFDQGNIREYVANSYYDYPLLTGKTAGLHPFDGVTTPNMGSVGGGYSWLKAPRYMNGTTPMVMEVGPLARMAVTHAAGVAGATLPVATSANAVTGLGITAGQTYNVSTLLTIASGVAPSGLTKLFSPLGRHAARALEAKYIADLVAGWITEVQADQPGYTYKRIPKQISTGYGLTEAPRGALGHWIKIEGRKVAKYQCVVPTTWNASPMGAGQNGPAEQSLMWANAGHSIPNNIGTDPTSQIVNILRLLHPFDFCIACAVHVVNPEGKEILKFAITPEGRPLNVDVKE